jgi:CRISPR-associated endonuclease Cas2
MSRLTSELTIRLLELISEKHELKFHEIKLSHVHAKSTKQIYDTLYRLKDQELITQNTHGYQITPAGQRLIHSKKPVRDNMWKVIIFDIPEKQRSVRNFLRQRLTGLGFKKWQNSIWVSPFKLDAELEEELKQLANKFFVRLIKTNDINHTKDLEQLFP